MTTTYGYYSGQLNPLKQTEAPEELLETLSGGCNKWQICISVITFLAEFIHGLNLYASLLIAPLVTNYSCKNGNGSRCFDVNGSECQEFVFERDNPEFETYTEKFSLVCDKEGYVKWIDNSFRFGLILSYLFTGWIADRYGRKIAAMTFIPLQCLSGAILITSDHYSMLLCLNFVRGFFSASLNLLPIVIISDATGNKWRTFALGFASYPLHISFVVETLLIVNVPMRLAALLALISFLPLTLLLPLLYFKNSPLYTFYKSDFVKGEEILRRIARFNNIDIKSNIRVIPAELMLAQPKTENIRDYFKFKETRYPFFALMCFYFLRGISSSFLLFYFSTGVTKRINMMIISVASLVGSIMSVILCHLIPHKVVLCIFAFLKNYLLLGALVVITSSDSTYLFGFNKLVVLLSLGMAFHSCVTTALDNITPRMFPTGLRSQGVGICLSVLHAGHFMTNVMRIIPQEDRLWFSAVVLIIVCPTFEIMSSFFLWRVHNREMPDFIEDAVFFQKYYKPARYISISDEHPSMSEYEVRSVDLDLNSRSTIRN